MDEYIYSESGDLLYFIVLFILKVFGLWFIIKISIDEVFTKTKIILSKIETIEKELEEIKNKI